jgi:hypothetical protein
MLTLKEFAEGDRNFVAVVNGKEVFISTKSDLIPILDYLDSDRTGHDDTVLFDRYIGRAAALLMTMLKPARVCTPVISKGGRAVFEEYGIEFEATETVEYLMGVASDGMCRWEKLAQGKSPSEFHQLVKSR